MSDIIHKNRILFSVFFFLTIGLISFSWFGSYLFTGTDVNFPIARSSALYHYFFTWSPLSTGYPNVAMTIMLPYGLFLIISDIIHLPLSLTQSIWYYFLFTLSGISSFLFSREILKKNFQVDIIIPPLIAGVFYMANPFVSIMATTYTFLWLTYATLPLKLVLLTTGLGKPQKFTNIFLKVLVWVLISSSSYTNPKYLILDLIPCIFLLISYILMERNTTLIKSTVIYYIKFFGLLFALNLYWLIPQSYIIKDSIVSVNRLYNSLGLSRSFGLHNSANSLLNAISLIGLGALTEGYRGIPYFKYSSYLLNPYIKIFLLTPVFFITLVALLIRKVQKNYLYIFCQVVLILAAFGMLGNTFPATIIGTFLTNKIPLYLDLISIPYTIYSIYYLIALTALLSLGIYLLKINYFLRKPGTKIFSFCLLIFLISIIGKPVWTGELMRKPDKVENKILTSNFYKIPDYYWQLKQKISGNYLTARILTIPYPYAAVVYQWDQGGYTGPEIGEDWIGNILFGDNMATNDLLNNIYSNNKINKELKNLSIKYIIFHKDTSPLMYENTKIYGGGKRISENNIIRSLNISGVKYTIDHLGAVELLTIKNDTALQASTPNIKFTFINPTKIIIYIKNASQLFDLSIPTTFDKNWHITGTDDKFPTINQTHFLINDYANGWRIDPNLICKRSSVCSKNTGGTYNITLMAEYWPQKVLYLGLGLSLLTVFLSFSYIIYGKLAKKLK